MPRFYIGFFVKFFMILLVFSGREVISRIFPIKFQQIHLISVSGQKVLIGVLRTTSDFTNFSNQVSADFTSLPFPVQKVHDLLSPVYLLLAFSSGRFVKVTFFFATEFFFLLSAPLRTHAGLSGLFRPRIRPRRPTNHF